MSRREPAPLRPKAPQPGAQLADEDLGLLEGGEVATLVGDAEVDQVAVGGLDPASRQAGMSRGKTVTATGRVSFGPAMVAERFSQ